MKNELEFYYDKSIIKKILIKYILILVFLILISAISLLKLDSVPLTTYTLALTPFIFLYFTIRIWIQFKYEEPVIIVSPQYLTLKNLNYLLSFTEVQINVGEIKTIGTDIKMKGEDVISEALSLKMTNDEKFSFPMDLFEITHNDIYKAIKELNPQAKLLNIGDFAYE